MGLTIHYRLKTDLTELTDVRKLVESMRQFAKDLPFQEELLEFQGSDASFEANPEDEHRWFKIQACGHVASGERYVRVAPSHIIGFSTWPGEGCEPANFGFCRYPAFVDLVAEGGQQRRLPTNLDGWCWSSFCKTQYASDPADGGVPNFLKCHVGVVKMLDFIHATNLVSVEVRDEAEYWDHRDLARLASAVGDWNELIAALAGQLKDQANRDSSSLVAAITGFENFEHLEARGLDRLRELRERFGKHS